MPVTYEPKYVATSQTLAIRQGHYRLWRWHADHAATSDRPLLVLVHGWMDVGASFQFMVDAMASPRPIVALDWRGFGQTRMPPTDAYWFADYLGDLDAVLDVVSPDRPVDLAGHSMGGNVVMSYAGVRGERVRRLVNLEGFGLPATSPTDAPRRLRQWLDALKTPASLRDYDDRDGVAQRLKLNNPRLPDERAAWLASHWGERRDDGRWHIQGDAAHKRPNPMLYRRDEIVETWREIRNPVLWVEGAQTDMSKWWGDRYPRDDFEARLAVVEHVTRKTLPDCGHMMHLDQPGQLARAIESYLDQ